MPEDAVLLIVEDDPHYARVLCDLSRDKGPFKVLGGYTRCGSSGAGQGVPPNASVAGCFLPDMLGWTVLNHLKQDPENTAHTGADADAGRRPPPRAGAGCLRICYKAHHAGRVGNGVDSASRSIPLPGGSGC